MPVMSEATVTQLSEFRERSERLHALPLRDLPAPPPSGTVTFLLTDIEGSTPRWEASPGAMATAVARHYEILDAAVARHGGVRPIEQGEGDSMVAAFPLASLAVAAALEAQSALTAETWPGGAEISVRMALHTGEAHLREQTYYVGPSIIRCARLRSLGHGGQVLVSTTTADLLVDALPAEAGLLPLGTHRLKGMRSPERVFQLSHPGLPGQFPPLASTDAWSTALPTALTSFVGRDAELTELARLMSSHRLVTVTGAGGTGKTRLALEGAGDAVKDYPDGVWWVEVVTITDPLLVARAVMTALGLEGTHEDPTARIASFLGDGRRLLVLDNCEHLRAPVAGLVTSLLTACPQLSVLATSREPLAVTGEIVWQAPPMSVPADAQLDLDAVVSTEAVRLFAERAAEARPGFTVGADNAAVVAALCARLDGLPLAIELAAARVRALTPQRILDGLTSHFALLVAGGRGAVPHHETLATSIAWSHDLLTEPQQILFRRLSVFVGRFTLDDVESVGAADPLTRWECLMLLADLVDRSMVSFDGEHYRMLVTLADFGAERLRDAGEEESTRTAHRAHYATMASVAAAELDVAPQTETLDRLEVARANILAAIEHAVTAGDHEAALAIAADMVMFWQLRSAYGESLTFLRRLLAATPDVPGAGRARALWGAGELAGFGMDLANNYGLAETTRAMESAAASGVPGIQARALAMIGFINTWVAPQNAVDELPAVRELAQSAGDRYGAMISTVYRAFGAAFGVDDFALAVEELVRLRAEADATGSPYWDLWHAACSGLVAVRTGRLADAVAIGVPAAERALVFGDSQVQFFNALPLADAYTDLGDDVAAERLVTATVAWQDRSALGRAEMMRLRRVRALLGRGDLTGAAAEIAAIEPVLRSLGFDVAVIELGTLQARLALENGDVVRAREAADDEGKLAAGLGAPWGAMHAANAAGRVCRAEGSTAAAEDAHHRALVLCLRHGYRSRAAETLECLASLAVVGESWAEAARLYAAADVLRAETGYRRPPLDAPCFDADTAAIASALGPEAHAAATAEGAELGFENAIAYAARARGERKRPSLGWDALTPAESNVVALVAQGLSNAQIGERLFITTGTVKAHLHTIFRKVGVSRRSELAVRALERRQRESNE